MTDAANAPLTRPERWGVYLLFFAMLLWGCLVEQRSAFLDRRMGDMGVYLRAGYAVLSGGGNLYAITDDNGWHYIYPPFFAILLTPFADPPSGFLAELVVSRNASGPRPEYVPMSGPVFLVPYEVSIGLWFLFSLGCLIWATHRLAGALEEHASDPRLPAQPRYCRRWWALRVAPVLICLLPIGHTLQRSQVNLLILALLCAMIASFIRRQSFRAGLWLSVACAIKVIPLFLVLYPVLKRDWRCLKGWCLGMFITIVAIPTLVWGPQTTMTVYKNYYQTLIAPGLHLGVDKNKTLNEELLGSGAKDNQSLKTSFYNLLHPQIPDDPVREDPRPGWETPVWFMVGLLLSAFTVAAGYKSGLRSSSSLGLFLGALVFLMSVLSPICHLHYFAYSMPMVMALLFDRWQHRRDLQVDRPLLILFGLFILANLVPHIVEYIRDVGLPLWAGLGLWFVAVRWLWAAGKDRGPKTADEGQQQEPVELSPFGLLRRESTCETAIPPA